MSINEEMARVDLLALDVLHDSGEITYEEYINEVKEIDKTYGTHLYAE